MSIDSIDLAYEKSLDLLHNLSSEKGFLASTEDVSNYKRLWARDSAVAILASLVAGDKDLVFTSLHSLESLRRQQDTTGRLPSNIAFDEKNQVKKVSYGQTVGRIDATIWYIIAVCQFAIYTEDKKFFNLFQESLKKALFYLECLELNNKGLIYFPQGADWADEYIDHGYILLNQLLRLIALKSYYHLTQNEKIAKDIEELTNLILINYFPDEENLDNPYVYNKVLFTESIKEYEPPLPISYFTTHSVHYHDSNFANALVLLTQICEPADTAAIMDCVLEKYLNQGQKIIPAFAPVITEDDPLWQKLVFHYRYEFKNKPYQFHNGGLWPLVHGFFLAGTTKEKGKPHLQTFAEKLAKDNFIFPEYYDGQTEEAQGTKYLGFSASAYIIAYNSLIKDRRPFIL
ncbi:MAG: glycoside hydrolase 100 family protein [Patescibacteria group bacterium]